MSRSSHEIGGGLSRSRALWGLVGLAAVVLIEVIWYPAIATLVNRSLVKGGGAGSSILFYRDTYVLPASLAFVAAVAVAAVYTGRRHRGRLPAVLWGAWAANLLLLGLSLWFYLRVVATAGEYRA